EELEGGRRRSESAVAQMNCAERLSRLGRVLQPHRPAASIARRRADRVDAASAAVEERGAHAPLVAQKPGGAIQRGTLADRAEVDLQPSAPELHRVRLRIQDDVPEAAPGYRRVARIRGRHATLATEEAPRLDERAGRDVERAFGLARPDSAAGEQVEQLL